MTHKRYVVTLFKHFEALMTRQFNANIKQLQCDSGGEFQALQTLFFKEFTLEELVVHILLPKIGLMREEIGRQKSLACLCSLELVCLWSFESIHSNVQSILLINCLLELFFKRIHMRCFSSKLTPTYNYLRTFGCLCYPFLKPHASHKVEPRFISCVFLDYLPNHKGYWCMHITNNKSYLSPHVVFS